MPQSLYFIAKVASGVSLVVGLLFFPLFSRRPKKIVSNVEVHGQVNSKAIYNDFLPATQARLCRVGQVNAESLASQRHRKHSRERQQQVFVSYAWHRFRQE